MASAWNLRFRRLGNIVVKGQRMELESTLILHSEPPELQTHTNASVAKLLEANYKHLNDK
jgi:hypothetical protein